MGLFEIAEVKNAETNQVYCKMPRVAFWLTEKGKPLSFLSGSIVVSYMQDEELKHGIIYHFLHAIFMRITGVG